MLEFFCFSATSLHFALSVGKHIAGSCVELFIKAGKAKSNNDNFQFWQQDNHPIGLITPKFTHQKLDYIHNNPVVAGIVEKPEDYLYSSARDYYGMKGLIDINLLDPLIITI